ncbi:MAG: NAD(P)H-hydrate dehydratase [Desulfurivibrio sp.]|nr:NAD(P)H-hydrate dehydratase [Desulfurivibrio sp.]
MLALDAPSGVNGDDGAILGEAVQATATVTFALAKPGLLFSPGREATGELEVADIGMPPEVYRRVDIRWEQLAAPGLAPWLPRRRRASHKGDFGHLLLLAGSLGKTGAALLAARGALRGGVGLLSAAVPLPLLPVFATALPELMTIPLPEAEQAAGMADLELLRAALTDKTALVMGPGLGTGPATGELVLTLYRELRQPVVVDADALNILASRPAALGEAAGCRILTPHPGEMARLLNLSSGEVQKDRLAWAAKLAARYQVWVVLKGADTVVAAPDGRLALNPTGNPGMATGGMGDVLAGLLGALLCQGLEPWRAACLGVYLHGLAADLLAAEYEINFGFTASEVADAIPAACRRLLAEAEASENLLKECKTHENRT